MSTQPQTQPTQTNPKPQVSLEVQAANVKAGYRPVYTWAAILSSTLGMFVFGYVLSAINPIQTFLTQVTFDWNSSTATSYTSLFNSLVTIGAGVGAFLGGPMAKYFGRRRTMLFNDCLLIFGAIFTLFANVGTIMFGRLVCGFAVGLNSAVVPLYVHEIAPLSIRATAGALNQGQICLGALVAFCLGFGVPNVDDYKDPRNELEDNSFWKLMLGFPMIFAFARFVIFGVFFRFETPTYLMTKNRDEQAKKCLGRIYKGTEVEEQFQELRRMRLQSQGKGKTIKYSSLFKKRYLKRFFLGCFIAFLQQMTGVNALIFYSNVIFKGAGGSSTSTATTLSAVFNVLNLVSTLFSGLVLKFFGRKPILIFGNIAISVCLLSISLLGWTGQSDMSKYPIMIFIIMFGLSYGPIVWVYVTEILPDLGVGIAILLNWVGAFLIAQFFQPLVKKVGFSYAFMFFWVWMLGSLVVIVLFVKETKGLTSEQIEEIYTTGIVTEHAKTSAATEENLKSGKIVIDATSPQVNANAEDVNANNVATHFAISEADPVALAV